MQYKINVAGRGPGSRFSTPHGQVEIDRLGCARMSDGQREHLSKVYGATFEPVVDGDVVLTELAVVEEPTPGKLAAQQNIAANRAAAQEAEHDSSTLPQRTKRKR